MLLPPLYLGVMDDARYAHYPPPLSLSALTFSALPISALPISPADWVAKEANWSALRYCSMRFVGIIC